MGKQAVTAYFIMGRSENSRNRVFVEDGEGIRTQAFDPCEADRSEPDHLCTGACTGQQDHRHKRRSDRYHLRGNGSSAHLRAVSYAAVSLSRTLRTIHRVFPVSCMWKTDSYSYAMSILKSNNGNPDRPATAILLHTSNPRGWRGTFHPHLHVRRQSAPEL